jgi:uncharacterized membrane protein
MKSDSDSDATNESAAEKRSSWFRQSFNPFRIATLRGLAVVLPPVLTIMLFAWAWNTIDRTVLTPVESLSENCVAWAIEEIYENETIDAELRESPESRANLKTVDGRLAYTTRDGKQLVQISNQWLPQSVYMIVNNNGGDAKLNTAHQYYKRYVQIRYLKRHLMIPALMAIFLAVMYLVGKLLAAGIGRFLWHYIESLINRLPIIRNVYSSVKQVTDFAFSENDVHFMRVVAVEYPRKGIWSIGFVTGEGFKELREALGEPIVSVLMPTSPMPATGFTIAVPKSETIDLDITIDQAIQYCVSCGVVVPDHQTAKAAIEGEVRRRNQPTPPNSIASNPAPEIAPKSTGE